MDDMDGEEGRKGDMEGGGLENDFSFHNNVAGASKHIRLGFLRKVYGLLSVQLTITTIIGAICLFTPQVKELVQANSWLLLPSFLLSLGLLIALHLKRKETPINLILL